MRVYSLILFFVLSILPVHAMEMEPVSLNNESAGPAVQSEISGENYAYGGAAAATQAVSDIELCDRLNELRLLMGVVVDGIVVKDHAVLLPGRAITVPLARASQWVNDALDDAFEKQYKGEIIIDSNDPLLRECQKAQKRLWDFVMSADLLASGTDNREFKEMLHTHRMLRVGALVTQDEEILKKVGRAPVMLEAYTQKQAENIHEQFTQSSVLLTNQNSKRKAGCFGGLFGRARKK